MSRIPKVYENSDGWSDWQSPVMRHYKMACCDCGLVHNMQFRVLKVNRKVKGGFEGTKINGVRIQFRASRNNRSTALVRRNHKKHSRKALA